MKILVASEGRGVVWGRKRGGNVGWGCRGGRVVVWGSIEEWREFGSAYLNSIKGINGSSR